MGLVIEVETAKGQRHPTWVGDKWSGARDFLQLMNRLETKSIWLDEITFIERPTDIPALRSILPKDMVNYEIWNSLLDILENETEYWIYISV